MARLGPLTWVSINTIEEAISFLRECLDIKTNGTTFGWSIWDGGDFEMFFETNEELIEHARYERDMLVKLWGEKE